MQEENSTVSDSESKTGAPAGGSVGPGAAAGGSVGPGAAAGGSPRRAPAASAARPSPSHVTLAVVLQVREGSLCVLLWQRARDPFRGA